MTTTIHIPTPLRAYTGQKSAVPVEGETVGEALSHLITQYPALKQHLYNEQDQLRSFVNVFLNDEDIRHLERTETQIRPSDELSIIPSIAGGS